MGIREETDPAKRNPHQHLVERVDMLESVVMALLRSLSKDQKGNFCRTFSAAPHDMGNFQDALDELCRRSARERKQRDQN